MVDPFATLGLPARYDLAPPEIEQRYRELQKALHPDRWLLWMGILFIACVYYFPAGIVGKLRGARWPCRDAWPCSDLEISRSRAS